MIRAAGAGYWLAGAVLAVSLHGATVLMLAAKAPPATPPAPDGGFVVELAEIETARPNPAPDLALGEDVQAQQAIAATTEMSEMAPPPEPDPVPEDIARPDPRPDRRPDRPAPPRQPARPEITESRTTHMVAATQDAVNRAKRQAVTPRKPDPQAVSAWMHALELALQRHKQYPESARRDRAEGRVVLRLALGADGNVVKVSVLSSSGFELLDKAALELVNAASPFPIPPTLGANGELRIRVPVDYALK